MNLSEMSYGSTGVASDTHAKYRATIEALKEKLVEQDEILQQVAARPAHPGYVLWVGKMSLGAEEFTCADVVFNGGMARLPLAKDSGTIKAGDMCLISDGGGVKCKIDPIPTPGRIVVVKKVLDKDICEVGADGQGSIIVRRWTREEVKDGDRVQLDGTTSLILRVLSPPPAPVEKVTVERVSWNDIGGHAEAKRELIEAIMWPLEHPELMKAYGHRGVKGILLWGPPGCGKTLIAKATATSIAGEKVPGFFSVRGPELMDPWVGETERKIRELFASARKHTKDHGTRAVIFIDEADSCLGHRGQRLHSDISVPTFLTEMDGVGAGENDPLVLLATNRQFDLDEAVVRDGRVDRRVEIKRPEIPDVQGLLAMYLSKSPVTGGIAAMAHIACEELTSSAILWDHRSGALIAGLVQRMTSIAMRRDVASGAKVPSGITREDCKTAITEAAGQY